MRRLFLLACLICSWSIAYSCTFTGWKFVGGATSLAFSGILSWKIMWKASHFSADIGNETSPPATTGAVVCQLSNGSLLIFSGTGAAGSGFYNSLYLWSSPNVGSLIFWFNIYSEVNIAICSQMEAPRLWSQDQLVSPILCENCLLYLYFTSSWEWSG